MGEPTMEKYMTLTRIDYGPGNSRPRIEVKGRFLLELRDDAFSGTNGEDAVEHIENFPKIVDSLNVPNVTHDRLRISIFPFSLTGVSSKWWKDESIGLITAWVHLKTLLTKTQEITRVPFNQRNNPPQNPRIVYPLILDINHFRHFLVILENLYPMYDEPMWVADHVVAPTPSSAITIPETANEFAIKDTENEVVRLMMFPLSLTREANTWLDELNEGTIETWDELRTTFISQFFPPALFDLLLGENQAFSQHENESLTDAWLRMKEMLRNYHGHNLSKGNIIKIFYHGLSEITQEVLNTAAGDAMILKMDAQYKELQSKAKKTKPDLDEDDIPMSREEEAKFMQTFCKTRFYNDYRDRDSNRDNWRSNE
ncbi:reverse transcriptase domain-containing protein [Tanacetum coccineum]